MERELAHLQVEQEALGHTRPSVCGGSDGSFSKTETWSLLSSTNHVFGPVRLLLIPGKWARTAGRPPGPLGDVARLVPEEGLTKAVAFTGFPWSWPQQLLPGSTSPLQPSLLSPADGAPPHPPLRMLRAQAGPGVPGWGLTNAG